MIAAPLQFWACSLIPVTALGPHNLPVGASRISHQDCHELFERAVDDGLAGVIIHIICTQAREGEPTTL